MVDQLNNKAIKEEDQKETEKQSDSVFITQKLEKDKKLALLKKNPKYGSSHRKQTEENY